jgi:mitochondrial fission protein ELM1
MLTTANNLTQSTAPLVWVLTDDRPGNTTQSLGLARALGWPYEVKALSFTPIVHKIKFFWNSFAATTKWIDPVRSSPLTPPWPDVVIAAGRRPAQVSRWIGKQSGGRTRLIQMGRKGGHVARLFDIVITPSYSSLPPHPLRIEIAAPLTQATPERLAEATVRWQHLFATAPHPHVMLLVGGATRRHQWTPDIARQLGKEVQNFAHAAGGSVFAITSRRTGAEAAAALAEGLGTVGTVHQWQPGQQENPYWAYLACADVLVVTGESESMLAEAAAVGKPVYIYPLPPNHPPLRLKKRLKARLKAWAVAHAGLRHTWQQRLLSPIATLLISSGFLRPRRDLTALHQALIRRGLARFFGGPLEIWSSPALREIDEVAVKIKKQLGY